MNDLLRNNTALVKLIYEVQNETASSSQLKTLSDLLHSDPEAQKIYVFLMDMHAELILDEEFLDPEHLNFFPDQLPDELPSKRASAPRKHLSYYLLLAVCYFIPLTVLSYFAYYAAQPFAHTRVAILDQIQAGLLTQNSQEISENDPLLTGHQYQLERGVARILMNSGVEVVLESPATFELLHHNSIRLWQGTLAAEVDSDAIGFVVETPSQRVVDLGTRFGVHVAEDGSSEAHVFHGKVVCSEVRNNQSETSTHLLEAGQAIQVKGDGSPPVTLQTNESTFTRALKFQAQIETLSGSIQYIQEMPKQIGAGDFTSSQQIFLFQEQKNLILPEDMMVWKIPSAGTTANQKELRHLIPKGTKVNVFLVHLDGPHLDPQGQQQPPVRLSAAIHFRYPVLGGFKTDSDFYATDQTLGCAGVAYDNEKFKRSGRGIDASDKTELSDEGQTLEVAWSQRGGGGIGRDQIRILVATEE